MEPLGEDLFLTRSRIKSSAHMLFTSSPVPISATVFKISWTIRKLIAACVTNSFLRHVQTWHRTARVWFRAAKKCKHNHYTNSSATSDNTGCVRIWREPVMSQCVISDVRLTSIVIVACDGSPKKLSCRGRIVRLISFSLIWWCIVLQLKVVNRKFQTRSQVRSGNLSPNTEEIFSISGWLIRGFTGLNGPAPTYPRSPSSPMLNVNSLDNWWLDSPSQKSEFNANSSGIW